MHSILIPKNFFGLENNYFDAERSSNALFVTLCDNSIFFWSLKYLKIRKKINQNFLNLFSNKFYGFGLEKIIYIIIYANPKPIHFDFEKC